MITRNTVYQCSYVNQIPVSTLIWQIAPYKMTIYKVYSTIAKFHVHMNLNPKSAEDILEHMIHNCFQYQVYITEMDKLNLHNLKNKDLGIRKLYIKMVPKKSHRQFLLRGPKHILNIQFSNSILSVCRSMPVAAKIKEGLRLNIAYSIKLQGYNYKEASFYCRTL